MAIININKRFKWIEQWKIKDTKVKAFNDGKLRVGEVTKVKSPRGAVVHETWKPVVRLMYDIVAIREEDKQQAYQTNTRLDLKVRVPNNRFIQENQTVEVDDAFYEIMRKDYGHDAVYLFLRKRTASDPKLVVVE